MSDSVTEVLIEINGIVNEWERRVAEFDSGIYGTSTRQSYESIRRCAREIRQVLSGAV